MGFSPNYIPPETLKRDIKPEQQCEALVYLLKITCTQQDFLHRKQEIQMKKKKKQKLEDEHELEILKAVAQAWHSHFGSSSSTNEFDALRLNFKSKPTRFKLEAMNQSSSKGHGSARWDFGQSLWDSYEIVTVSKRLETGLVLDHQFSRLDDSTRIVKWRKERKNSLRNLFNRVASRRFNEDDIPRQEGFG